MRVLRGEWNSPLAAQREAHGGWSHEIEGPARNLSLERKGRAGFAEPHRLRTSLEFLEHGRNHMIHPRRTSLSSHGGCRVAGSWGAPSGGPGRQHRCPLTTGHAPGLEIREREKGSCRGEWSQLCGRSTAPASPPLCAGLQGPMWAEACSARTRSRWGCEEGARLPWGKREAQREEEGLGKNVRAALWGTCSQGRVTRAPQLQFGYGTTYF